MCITCWQLTNEASWLFIQVGRKIQQWIKMQIGKSGKDILLTVTLSTGIDGSLPSKLASYIPNSEMSDLLASEIQRTVKIIHKRQY